MANWTNLKDSIAKVIKANGNQEITGDILQQTLLSIVGNVGDAAQFKGVAIPSTVPDEVDGNQFYLASTQGSYPNFANLEVGDAEIAVFVNKREAEWEKLSLPIKSGSDIKVSLLKGGNVTATPTGSGVVLSVPTLQPDGSETKSNLVVNVASKTQTGVMSSAQVNDLENTKTGLDTLKKEYGDTVNNLPDFIVGSNDDSNILTIDNGEGDFTNENHVGVSLKTKDSGNGTESEVVGYFEGFDPVASESNVSGKAGMVDFALFDHIPRVFNGIADLKVSDDASKALIPVYAKKESIAYETVATENHFYGNGPATPRAGDRIRMNTYTETSAELPSWAIVTCVQRHDKNIWVFASFGHITYTFSYVVETYLVNTAWTELSQGKYIYDAEALLSLTEASPAADLRAALKPIGGITYRIPKTGDLLLYENNIGVLSLRVVESSDVNVLYISKTNGETIEAKIDDKGFSGWTVSSESKPVRYTSEYLLSLDESSSAGVIKQGFTPTPIEFGSNEAGNYHIFAATEPRFPQEGDVVISLDARNKGLNDFAAITSVIYELDGPCLIRMSAPLASNDHTAETAHYTLWVSNDFTKVKPTITTDMTLEAYEAIEKVNTVGTLRDLYISAGARYNEATGYYELNGLTDITEEEMRIIWQEDLKGLYPKGRTNLPNSIGQKGNSGEYNNGVDIACICIANNNLQVFNLGQDCYVRRIEAAFSSCHNLKTIDTRYKITPYNGGLGTTTFRYCDKLKEVRFNNHYLTAKATLNFYESSLISKESILSAITTTDGASATGAGFLTITLHPDAYARLKDDADITAALEEKGGVVVLASASA